MILVIFTFFDEVSVHFAYFLYWDDCFPMEFGEFIIYSAYKCLSER